MQFIRRRDFRQLLCSRVTEHVGSVSGFGEMKTLVGLPMSWFWPRMSHMHSTWKLLVLVAFLVLFAGVGIAHMLNPDWFIERSGVRKGGEMLTGWNRWGFRFAGATFTGVAVYLLYVFLRDYLTN
jgi:hypothetical protein